MRILIILLIVISSAYSLTAQSIDPKITKTAESLEKKVIEWRRDFHQNPELSNREFETAKKIAKHLKDLGLELSLIHI